MKRHAAATVLLALLPVLIGGWATASRAEDQAAAPGCNAWPGEISPLPTVSAADPVTARWARERVRALAADARLVEAMSLAEARRYWNHVLCMDPQNDAARAGLFRTGRFRVSGPLTVEPSADAAGEANDLDAASLAVRLNPGKRRPRVAVPAEPEANVPELDGAPAPDELAAANPRPSEETFSSPWDAADPLEPIAPSVPDTVAPATAPVAPPTTTAAPTLPGEAVAASPPAVSTSPPPAPLTLPAEPAELTSVDQELSEIETLVGEAHFATALSVAASTRTLLQDEPDSDAISTRRARLEVLAATAAVALGRNEEALVCMSDALRADPRLELETGSTSPKVVAIFEEARRAPRPARLRVDTPDADGGEDLGSPAADFGAS